MRAYIVAVISVAAIALTHIAPAQSADKEFIGPVPQDASSTAVKVPAGQHLLFLAGHTASRPKGGAAYGNFEAQMKAAMAKIDTTLKASGGTLQDIVQLSVFLTDMRYQPEFAKLAKDIFKSGFPATTYVEVSHLSDPQLLIEIQPIAVVP
jgi:enamine deaminase RidA (YjgF/YER057c/UK114 family)